MNEKEEYIQDVDSGNIYKIEKGEIKRESIGCGFSTVTKAKTLEFCFMDEFMKGYL